MKLDIYEVDCENTVCITQFRYYDLAVQLRDVHYKVQC